MKIFETERLYIRRFTEADREACYRLNSDPDVMRYIREPLSRDRSAKFLLENIAIYSKFPEYGRWALMAKENGSLLGSFMLKHSDSLNAIEMGYALFPGYWGMGYATEAVQGGLDYAFGTIGLKTVMALTFPENEASQKVLLKNGFRFVHEFWDEGNLLHLFQIDNLNES